MSFTLPLVMAFWGAGHPSVGAAQEYDMDCAVILCMAGAFAPQECRPPWEYMMERLRRGRSPVGVCTMSDGSSYENYQVNVDRLDRYSEEAWLCREGDRVHLDITYNDDDNPVGSTAFCYRESYVGYGTVDGEAVKVTYFPEAYSATRIRYRMETAVQVGLPDKWGSGELLVSALNDVIDPDDIEVGDRRTESVRAGDPATDGPDPQDAGADFPVTDDQTYLPSNLQGMKSVWAPGEAAICSGGWSTTRPLGVAGATGNRVSCVSNGGETVVALKADGSVANSMMKLTPNVDVPAGTNVVSSTVDLFIPNDYRPFSGGRLPHGIQIGGADNSGGAMPDEQQGTTVRTNFAVSGDSIKLTMYSYHLNRGGIPVFKQGNFEGANSAAKMRLYGEAKSTGVTLPKGKWISLVQTVRLNDPGSANGSAELSIYDGGRRIGQASISGAVFRKPNWKPTPTMVDKYDRDIPAPRDQAMYFRNFEFHAGVEN